MRRRAASGAGRQLWKACNGFGAVWGTGVHARVVLAWHARDQAGLLQALSPRCNARARAPLDMHVRVVVERAWPVLGPMDISVWRDLTSAIAPPTGPDANPHVRVQGSHMEAVWWCQHGAQTECQLRVARRTHMY